MGASKHGSRHSRLHGPLNLLKLDQVDSLQFDEPWNEERRLSYVGLKERDNRIRYVAKYGEAQLLVIINVPCEFALVSTASPLSGGGSQFSDLHSHWLHINPISHGSSRYFHWLRHRRARRRDPQPDALPIPLSYGNV